MERRPDPDTLLRQLEKQTSESAAAGRLKIFFGYAAGVGKTYAMLEAAHAAQKNGADVVVGYIEPHTRPETMALLEGLPSIPPRTAEYKGMQLKEFDLDAALARHPQLILVDELAHTNAGEARHQKRYQDVKELLHAGIDVYTTVNVQHLESLNDLVASITGVMVRERIPDRVFDEAYQVELVDIEPEELLERLQSGKIYRAQQARRALSHFFTVENLVALREIALRRTADRVNRRAQESLGGEKASAPIAEHLLICISAAPSNAKVIRTAARMSEAFHGRFTALYVAPTALAAKGDEEESRLRQNIKLAQRLGARLATVYGDDVPAQIAQYAHISGVTQIVMGRSNTRRTVFTRRGGMVDRLSRLAPDIDIYIIPDTGGMDRKFRGSWRGAYREEPVTVRAALLAGLIFAASTALSVLCEHLGFNQACVITLYVFGLLLTAVVTANRIIGVLMAAASVLTYNYFFTEPYLSLAVYDPGYLLAFGLMFCVSMVTGSLARRVKRQAGQEAMKAHRTEVLLQTSQILQRADDEKELLSRAAAQLVKLLDRSVVVYPGDDGLGSPLFVPASGDRHDAAYYETPDEYAVAVWAFQNRRHAGATTGTLPGARSLYLTVRSERTVYAVIGISMADGVELDSFEKNLLLALLDVIALAMERLRLNGAKNRSRVREEQESLRNDLLLAISHALYQPSNEILGIAGRLSARSSCLDAAEKNRLTAGLTRHCGELLLLSENLLSIAQAASGGKTMAKKEENLYQIMEDAVAAASVHGGNRSFQIDGIDGGNRALSVCVNARLMVQAIVNLLENAVSHSPDGSIVRLRAMGQGQGARVEVADEGAAIPEEEMRRLFELPPAPGRNDETGFGLPACKCIVEAHGGEISARNRQPHGTVISFTIP